MKTVDAEKVRLFLLGEIEDLGQLKTIVSDPDYYEGQQEEARKVLNYLDKQIKENRDSKKSS